MGAIANTIAIVVIVCVGYLIIKKVYPTAVLMIAGLVLLCCAVLLDVEPGLALKKGTGSEFFDIFKIIQDVFSTTLGGLGLNIMCMGGFAKYMDKLEAGRSLYDVVSAPLKYVKNPYMLAMAGFIVDQLLGMAIPSASGLGLLMMVTMYPVFIRAGVPRMTAVCVIAAGQVFGKGLTAIGAVNALIAGAESMGLGVMSLIIVMGVIIGIIAFLMGSGNAPFYSFASIAPAIAEKFGVHAADVLLPLQTMTGFGRTMSPVTGGIVAVAGMAGVSPFRVVKRNMVPLLCCCVVNFLVVYLFILP